MDATDETYRGPGLNYAEAKITIPGWQDVLAFGRENVPEKYSRFAVRTGGDLEVKLSAAQAAVECGIDAYIMSGEKPERLYDLLLNDEPVGTRFVAR